MKRIICVALSAVLIFALFPVNSHAETWAGRMGTPQIYERFRKLDRHLSRELSPVNTWGYRKMASEIEGKPFAYQAISIASKVQKVYPDEEQCVKMLTNYITLQSMNTAQQVAAQKQFDHTKKNWAEEGPDFEGVVEIGLDFIDGAELLKEYGPLIDAVTGGGEFLQKNEESAKTLETILRSHNQARALLGAVAAQAKDPDLRSAASALAGNYDALLRTQLEYLNENCENILLFTGEYFLKNMYIDVIRSMDIYDGDALSEWWLDQCEKGIDGFFTGLKEGEFSYKMMILAGDTAFGTSNSYIRYQEMRLTSDIAQALLQEIRQIQVSEDDSREELLYKIQKKLDLYNLLIGIHGRGEHCLHELLANEGGLFSYVQNIKDIYENGPAETYDGMYNQQLARLSSLEFEIETFRKTVNPEVRPDPQEGDRPGPRPDPQEGVHPGPRPDLHEGVRPGPRPELQEETRPEPRPELQEETHPEPQPNPPFETIETTPEPQLDATVETQPETRPGRVPYSPDLVIRNYGIRIEPVYAFGTVIKKQQVSAIEFLDSLENAPENARDVSETGNGKVLIWPEKDGDLWKLYIAGDGAVYFPQDSSYFFAGGDLDTLQYNNLTQIDFSDAVDTSTVRNMRDMFSRCEKLKVADLSAFETGAVTDMSGMFNECSGLESVDLSSFDTSGVTNMEQMFRLCTAITEIDLKNFDTSNVENMSYMFENCTCLKQVDLSCFTGGSLLNGMHTGSYMMFLGCPDDILIQVAVDMNNQTLIPIDPWYDGFSREKNILVSE